MKKAFTLDNILGMVNNVLLIVLSVILLIVLFTVTLFKLSSLFLPHADKKSTKRKVLTHKIIIV